MKTIPSSRHSRVWTIAELPEKDPRDKTSIDVGVSYIGVSNCENAIPLDTFVVPLFKLAPRLLEVVHARVCHDLATMGLTKAEIDEVKRLGWKPPIQSLGVTRFVRPDLFRGIIESLDRADADVAELVLDAADMADLRLTAVSHDVKKFESRYRRYTNGGDRLRILPEP